MDNDSPYDIPAALRALYEDTSNLPRNITSDASSKPNIDVVLATGAQNPTVKEACENFAEQFDFRYLSMQDYLGELCDTSKYERAAYGFLHPEALQRLQSLSNTPLFAAFLMPILCYKIGREVSTGCRRFLVLGLDEYAQATRRFCEQVAEPIAVFSFTAAEGEASLTRSFESKRVSKLVLSIRCGSSLGETYERLVGRVATLGRSSSPSYSESPSP